MQCAPAVYFRVTRSCWHLFAISIGVLLGCGSAVLFALHPGTDLTRLGLVAVVVAVCAAFALWGWSHSPVGVLRCDGAVWSWCDVPCTAPKVHLDFQAVLWVAFTQTDMRIKWMWLESTGVENVQWLALRRALRSGEMDQTLSLAGNAALNHGDIL